MPVKYKSLQYLVFMSKHSNAIKKSFWDYREKYATGKSEIIYVPVKKNIEQATNPEKKLV